MSKFLSIILLSSVPFLSLGTFLDERDFSLYAELEAENEDFSETNVYDPFIDYTEFEKTEKEKKDIQFFKEGRFITLGLGLGGRLFTGSLQRHMAPFLNYGAQVGLFLNLNFMLQFYELFSIHPMQLGEDGGIFQLFGGGIDLKYFFDKERLTRSIAFFNPYLLVGFSMIQGTLIPNGEEFRRQAELGFGFRTGGGFEIQIGERFFTGLHVDFNFIEFGWELQEWTFRDGTSTYLKGDLVNILYIVGLNF